MSEFLENTYEEPLHLHYAMYRISDGYIENVIIYDESIPYTPPNGYALEKMSYDFSDTTYGVGDYRIGEGEFKKGVRPIQPTQEEQLAILTAQLDALREKIKPATEDTSTPTA